MPERAGKRLLIVEEALKDFVGHWYEYVKAVAELNRAAGAEVTIVGHARAVPELCRELGVQPLFARTLWDGDYRHRWRLVSKFGLIRHNWLVFTVMRRFLARHGRFDCVFAPTVVGHHVWGWRLALWWHRRRIGRLVLLIRNNVAMYAPGSTTPVFPAAAQVIRWGIRSFRRDLAAGRVALASDSARLAEEYHRLSGIAPTVFPSPRIAAPVATPSARDSAASPLFACLGPARFEKGIDVLQRAIALYLADPENPPARFAIQWPAPLVDADGAAYPPDPALAASGRVEFVTEPLGSAEYDALLAATDAMVLPYRRSSYFARISGVAVEAVTAGIPVIATAQTWTSELVEASGAGIAVPDGDAPALASAIARMARELGAFRAAAQARRGDALAAHSGEEFVRLLWGQPAAL